MKQNANGKRNKANTQTHEQILFPLCLLGVPCILVGSLYVFVYIRLVLALACRLILVIWCFWLAWRDAGESWYANGMRYRDGMRVHSCWMLEDIVSKLGLCHEIIDFDLFWSNVSWFRFSSCFVSLCFHFECSLNTYQFRPELYTAAPPKARHRLKGINPRCVFARPIVRLNFVPSFAWSHSLVVHWDALPVRWQR